jgi:folate-binding Fe-S cluster repair protein YgfZ
VNETWKTFIRDNGAVLEGERVVHFGNPAQESRAAAAGNVLADLSDLALIRARGDDALNFLNGQLSNDIKALDPAHSQLASWCSPKGRMLVIFRIFRRGSDYLLQLPAVLQENILKRLRMFVLRAKVTLESTEAELVSIGLSGPDAEIIMREATGFAPGGENLCETRNEISIVSLPGPHPRFQIIAPASVAIKLWEDLKAKATPVGPPVWAWLDIMAGIPTVLPQTSEAFVPQMANLLAACISRRAATRGRKSWRACNISASSNNACTARILPMSRTPVTPFTRRIFPANRPARSLTPSPRRKAARIY